ncbi:hypothetical protein [Oceanisphaera sp. W20_SRM_FM3]|uniref:hypothetical protein n=1 Tax=Oceanisphaera sp. W20_SRM_FM3 TaxID=3240267 RepID=UPI003F968B6A
MPQQQILAVIRQLAVEEKAITTAAVRARLTTPVPLSELLALVSRYKQSPDSLPPLTTASLHGANTHAQPESELSELSERLLALEQLVTEQALRLERLEHLLATTLGGKND